MPAGTIALTINSKTVTGTGTVFTTEIKVNDFVVAVVGGVTYTLGVASIESNTSLTLNTVFGGPTTAGLTWTAVPNQAMVGITAQIAADTARAIRGLNYEKDNWQRVYSGSGTITVTLPDGSTYTGPSWGGITTTLATKADKTALDAYAKKGANSDITSLSGLTNPLSLLQGGVGATTAEAGRANLGVTSSRVGQNVAIMKIGEIIDEEWVATASVAIGAFNAQVVGGITFYTHFYRFTLPSAMPNGIIGCSAVLVGDTFNGQAPGYNADVKVRRDAPDGSGLSKTEVTISIKTPQTGWFPTFNIRARGY